jgi:preprotein translocase subunit SecG
MVNERFIVRFVMPFIITFFIISFFVSCASTKKNGTKNLRRVDLFYNLPIVTDRGDSFLA